MSLKREALTSPCASMRTAAHFVKHSGSSLASGHKKLSRLHQWHIPSLGQIHFAFLRWAKRPLCVLQASYPPTDLLISHCVVVIMSKAYCTPYTLISIPTNQPVNKIKHSKETGHTNERYRIRLKVYNYVVRGCQFGRRSSAKSTASTGTGVNFIIRLLAQHVMERSVLPKMGG